jgi:hypothetical protein
MNREPIPWWLGVIGFLIMIAVLGAVDQGSADPTTPPGDVNCISGVQMVGCTP